MISRQSNGVFYKFRLKKIEVWLKCIANLNKISWLDEDYMLNIKDSLNINKKTESQTKQELILLQRFFSENNF